MPESRRLLLIISLLLGLGFGRGLGQGLGAEPALSFPERLRPGDPLLVWVAGGLEGGRLELLDPAGRLLESRPLFELRGPALPSAPGPALEEGPGPSPEAASGPALDAGASLPPEAGPEEALPGIQGGLIGLPLVMAPGSYGLRLKAREGEILLERSLLIEERDFPSEDIPLDAANTALRAAPDPAKEAEARLLFELYARASEEASFLDGPLLLPAGEARRSAGFGDRRRYLYSGGGVDSSVHAGVDFAVPVGTEVLAPARGRVAFAAARIVTGKTLVLEHLPGLYSVYMHLSEILAAPGELVERGAPVAKSGNTGLSTGPHLHWELRASGRPVDPDFWALRAPLDTEWLKNAVSSPAIEGR